MNTTGAIEAVGSLEFTSATSLNATLLVEQVLDPTDDSFFEDHGLYVEEPFLSHEVEEVTLALGRFNVPSGNEIPGLHGDAFTEDYEINEKLGGAIGVPFDAFGGENAVSFAVFAAHTTAFNGSLIQDRGLTRESDGGVSNTQSPETIAFWLAGEFEGGTSYGLGAQFPAKAEADTDDQLGFVFGLAQAFPFLEDSDASLMFEGGYFPSFDGVPESALYGKVGAEVPVGSVDLVMLYSLRDIEDAPNDQVATLSAGFGILDALSAEIGYLYTRDGGEYSRTVGAVLIYELGVENGLITGPASERVVGWTRSRTRR